MQWPLQLRLSCFVGIACWILLGFQVRIFAADDLAAKLDEILFPLSELDMPILPVKIQGKDVELFVDTAASVTVLDQKFRPLLGSIKGKDSGLTATGSVAVEFFDMPEMTVGPGAGIRFRPSDRVACSDLSLLVNYSGLQNVGYLGADFLKWRIFRLNIDDQSFEFPQEPSLNWPHRERVRTIEGLPSVRALLPDGYTSFILVTGTPDSSIGLDRATFNRLLKKKKIAQVNTKIFKGATGPISVRSGTLESLEFTSHRFFNLTVTETAVNTLQLFFLRRFNFELDWPNGTARFRPSKWIDLADRRDRSGFGVKDKAILEVDEGSNPARDAGIQTGDRLVKFNGHELNKSSMTELFMLRTEPGGELSIAYERDGVTREVVLTLSNNPDPFPAKSPHEAIDTDPDF